MFGGFTILRLVLDWKRLSFQVASKKIINRTPEPNSKDVCAFNCRVNRVKKRLFLSVEALPF